MTRIGLRAKTVLVFGLLFACLTVAASTASYFLLRNALTDQRTGPSPEVFQSELEVLAAERNLEAPEADIAQDGRWALADDGATGPMASPELADGRLAMVAIDEWLAERFSAEVTDQALDSETEAPTSPAEFDQQIFLIPLAEFERIEPGTTADLFSYLETLETADGSALFPEPPTGDGDLCLALIIDCEELTAGIAAMTELFEVDTATVDLMDDALNRALDQAQADALAAQLRISIGVAAVTLALAVGAAWLVTQRMLRPVREVTVAAKAASADSLDRRIDLDGPDDELKELADTFDEMLGRLNAAFDAHRRFGSNAAHELKTPLAVLRAEIDTARLDAPAESREEALLDRMERAVARSERLVAALLDLARAEGASPEPEPVDLAAVVGDALLARAGDLAARDLEVDYDVAETGHRPVVDGDPALIDILVANLVDNAAKYATEGSCVLVGIRASTLHVELRVSNEGGSELSPATVGELAEPFRRGQGRSSADRSGSGLGLSIVAAVARAHGATVDLRARRGGGLVVVVRFEAGRLAIDPRPELERATPDPTRPDEAGPGADVDLDSGRR